MVGSNLSNHLRDFKEGIKIKALFSWGQCGPRVVCGKGGVGGFLIYSIPLEL
jgi:hypothetical protein